MFISNWIDINKQEPQDRQSCLIYTQRGKIFRAEWYKGKNHKGDWYYSNRYYDSSTAIYWMPSPLLQIQITNIILKMISLVQ